MSNRISSTASMEIVTELKRPKKVLTEECKKRKETVPKQEERNNLRVAFSHWQKASLNKRLQTDAELELLLMNSK